MDMAAASSYKILNPRWYYNRWV